MSFVRRAMGVGAVQANMALFGAEQAQEDKTTVRYFDVYYAAVNTGGLLAFGAIAYLQINTDFFIGYLVPGGLLITGFVLFLSGCPWYIHRKPQKSLITEFLPTIVNACQSWRNHRDTSVESSDRASSSTPRPLSSWLDYAMVENQGRFSARTVNDIKSFGRIVVVFLLLIPYWLLYVQVETTFIVQGAHMKLPTTFDKLPVVWLSLGNQIIIIGRCHATGR
jgi:solute carrier family 15 (peptide/histidine transporter), member 3/4